MLWCRYGFAPHRVALLIYWQALKLLHLGLPLYSPPKKHGSGSGWSRTAVEVGACNPTAVVGRTCPHFTWTEAKSWPWSEAYD